MTAGDTTPRLLRRDKAYGTKNDLKSLVDACHERGIAVILDVVYNHADQPNPFITMYWEDWTVLPYNPWFNTTAAQLHVVLRLESREFENP